MMLKKITECVFLSVCKKRKMLYNFLTDVVNGKILGKGYVNIDPIVDVLRENDIRNAG